MALSILARVAPVVVGTVMAGYAIHIPTLISNANKFRHDDKIVNSIKELQVGDHIIFKRDDPGPSHHAIVVDVDETEKEFKIIHIRSSETCRNRSYQSARGKRYATIHEDTKKFNHEKTIFVRKYKKEPSERSAIVARAYTLLENRDQVEYNSITNNCHRR